MKRITVMIRRNEHSTVEKDVPPWELFILAAIHGEDAVEFKSETDDGRDYPDPQQEYERLDMRYGASPDDPDDHVVWDIFGKGRIGVRALRTFIDDTKAGENVFHFGGLPDDEDEEQAELTREEVAARAAKASKRSAEKRGKRRAA